MGTRKKKHNEPVLTPEKVGEILEELERLGEVRRTGAFRNGAPVYVATNLSEEAEEAVCCEEADVWLKNRHSGRC